MGLATVYLVQHTGIRKHLALKLPVGRGSARSHRSSRALSAGDHRRLDHPNVAAASDLAPTDGRYLSSQIRQVTSFAAIARRGPTVAAARSRPVHHPPDRLALSRAREGKCRARALANRNRSRLQGLASAESAGRSERARPASPVAP